MFSSSSSHSLRVWMIKGTWENVFKLRFAFLVKTMFGCATIARMFYNKQAETKITLTPSTETDSTFQQFVSMFSHNRTWYVCLKKYL